MHPKSVMTFDVILVVSPDHSRLFADAAWDRRRVLDELHSRLQIDSNTILRGVDGMAEGLPDRFRDRTVPKFRPDGILLTHAGGGAGLFSSIIAGWANGDMGSQPVTVAVKS
jgi:hypothetical protein